MSKISHKKFPNNNKYSEEQQRYLSRITKTLYYGKLPKSDILSLPVTELAVEIFSETQKGKSLDRLHCSDAAKISRNACVSPCSLVLAMLYFERLKKSNPDYLDRTAPSDLFLVSLMVSSKFLFDDGEGDAVFIDEWAASGGLTVKELVQLEKDFLEAIDWEIYVSDLSFWKKLNEIETKLAKREGISRGHFTYTELQTLSSTIEIQNVIQCLVAVSVILTATYTAGLLTMVGSVFLVSHVPGTSLYSKELKLDNQCLNVLPLEYLENAHALQNDSDETAKADYTISKCNRRNIDVLSVLKTGIFLASIKTNASEKIDDNIYLNLATTNDTNMQDVTWDWWNVPVMNWLAKTSEILSVSLETPLKHYFNYYLENKAVESKLFELEDQIHKATKRRIQDQLESSWHEEWIDTIKQNVYYNSHVQNIKS